MSNSSEHSDEHLMMLYQRGTHTALEELYHRYSRPLLRFSMSMLNNDKQSAQDVLHDAFIQLAEHPERFDTNRVFKPWIYTVVANACKKRHRKPESISSDHADLGFEAKDANQHMDQVEFKKALRHELTQLKHQHRCTFILRFHEKLSISDISNIMDCSEGTVKSRIHYCLKHLSKKLHHFNPIQTD